MNPALICELGNRAAVATLNEDDWDDLIVRVFAVPVEHVALVRQCAEREGHLRPYWHAR